MESDLVIRRLTRTDPDFYCVLGPFFGNRAIAKELGLPLYDDPDRTWMVAWIGDQAVGCSSLTMKGSHAVFKSGWVHPAYRQRGVYNALFEARLALAQASGVTQITATVTDQSKNTHLRHGFSVIGHRGRYLLMRKEWNI